MNKHLKLTVLLAVLLLAALPLTALAADRTVDCPYIGCPGKADLVGFVYKNASEHYCVYQCRLFSVVHVSSCTYTEAHNFNQKVVRDRYFAANPTCTEPEKYYYSCACGAKGTETFNVGSPLGHMFIEYIPNDDYDCTHDGTKTATCENGCGATDTIPDPGTALGHMFIDYIPDGNATCKADGTKTAICDNGCGATKTVPDEGSHLNVPHTFGEWHQDPTDKEGMLTRKCKVCGFDEYRYVKPIQTKDYPVVQTLFDAAKEAKEGESWFIVDSDKILTPDELEAMSALSPAEQVLVFTSVIGYEDQVNEVLADAEPLSEEAAKLKDAIQQRIAGLQDEEAAAFQSALDTYFPSQILVLDPYGNDYEAELLTVRVTSGEETRDEAYGFRRISGVWSFGQL